MLPWSNSLYEILAQWLEPSKQAYEQKMGSLASFAHELRNEM